MYSKNFIQGCRFTNNNIKLNVYFLRILFLFFAGVFRIMDGLWKFVQCTALQLLQTVFQYCE